MFVGFCGCFVMLLTADFLSDAICSAALRLSGEGTFWRLLVDARKRKVIVGEIAIVVVALMYVLLASSADISAFVTAMGASFLTVLFTLGNMLEKNDKKRRDF